MDISIVTRRKLLSVGAHDTYVLRVHERASPSIT